MPAGSISVYLQAGRPRIAQTTWLVRAFLHWLSLNRDRPHCLAGDAVLIAPVSTQIPC
jgi:hypothetical protein